MILKPEKRITLDKIGFTLRKKNVNEERCKCNMKKGCYLEY